MILEMDCAYIRESMRYTEYVFSTLLLWRIAET
jgi:hypothetical protein